ncbi:hypothetical protein ANN_17327 [Periplaneta americana]|uniref:Uncharacterized protein n=1 Tax=Periplaneta americana TaxID=6978 RepID=A0ABQ8SU18_PERAM|nr:hypothetical protein ANN_17327 [Periplaneta americana]
MGGSRRGILLIIVLASGPPAAYKPLIRTPNGDLLPFSALSSHRQGDQVAQDPVQRPFQGVEAPLKVLLWNESWQRNCEGWEVRNGYREDAPFLEEIRHQHRFSINVWADVHGDRLIGPYVLPQRLTGSRYQDFLINVLSTLLVYVLCQQKLQMWFMHDGTPAHFSRNECEHLSLSFQDRWIDWGGPAPWPARSPNLNPLDVLLSRTTRIHMKMQQRLFHLTESFSWEELPVRDEETGELTMAGWMPRIDNFVKKCVPAAVGVHIIQSIVRIIGDRNMIYETRYPFDTSLSPVYEIIMMTQLLTMLRFIALSFGCPYIYASMICVACTQLQKVKISLLEIKRKHFKLQTNLEDTETDPQEENVIQNNLNNIVRLHQQVIRKVQDNTEGLALNGLHQFLLYADDVNMLGENPQKIRENTEILLEACKAIGLEVNPEKTKRLRWAGHVARMGQSINAYYSVLVGMAEGRRPLGRPRRKWEDNIETDLRENLENMTDLTRVVFLYVLATSTASVYCAFGTVLSQEYESVSNAAWASDWVGTPVSFQKCVSLIMSISDQGFTLTAAKFVPVSNSTLMSMINESMSLFMFLLTMKEKNE